jgi:hypothetical protein
MSRTMIMIDADVHAALRALAIPFVDKDENDVLRRHLVDAAPPAPAQSPARPTPHRAPGALKVYLDQGLLHVGDPLVHRMVRKGLEWRATVTEDGWVKTDGGEYRAPSPALKECVGSEINGWHHWTHETSGKRLTELRKMLE